MSANSSSEYLYSPFYISFSINIRQHCALLWLIVQATGTFPLPDAVTALMGIIFTMADTTNATISGGIILYRTII